MSDQPLKEARDFEERQFIKRLHRLLDEQRRREATINADMAQRGYSSSGARGKAILASRVQTTREIIDGAIMARRDLAVRFPALGSSSELDSLRIKVEKWVDGFAKPWVPPGVDRRSNPARAGAT